MNADYQEALDYFYRFVNFEHRRLDQFAPENFTLERPRQLLANLGNPQLAFPSIHIAGTKGKGSVAAMCAAALQAAGYRVGLYTSPHMQSFRERIRLLQAEPGDDRISREEVVAATRLLKSAMPLGQDPTWYELITAMAFLTFARAEVDCAIVEVGLGGRLDATNVITPLVSVITSLSLDHTYLLGNSLAEIAGEKGGIIKPGVPIITAPQVPEALQRLDDIAESRKAPLILIGRDWTYEAVDKPPAGATEDRGQQQEIIIRQTPAGALVASGSRLSLALAGGHQQENAVVALAALEVVKNHFPLLSAAAAAQGLAEVRWPGRLQLLPTGAGQPRVLVDCAHNIDSAEKLGQAIQHDFEYDSLWLIIGITSDKDKPGILRALLPLADRAFVTSSDHPRAARPEELLQIAKDLGFQVQASPEVELALASAWREAGPGDLICVTGSIFVVANLLKNWETLQFVKHWTQ